MSGKGKSVKSNIMENQMTVSTQPFRREQKDIRRSKCPETEMRKSSRELAVPKPQGSSRAAKSDAAGESSSLWLFAFGYGISFFADEAFCLCYVKL